jgi:hypothetical protein
MAQLTADSIRNPRPAWSRFSSLLPVGIVVAIAGVATFAIWPLLSAADTHPTTVSDIITTGFSVVLAALLSMMPAVICTVQNVSMRRQQAELETLRGTGVADTALYIAAQRAISDDAGDSWIDSDFIVPTFVYFLVCFVGFIAMFIGFGRPELFKAPTVFLGGVASMANIDAYVIYQRETFAVCGMALAGAYAYSLGRILDRINNNDLYPVSLYYYAARIIIACIVASVLRHTVIVLELLPVDGGDKVKALLLLLGFIIGFTPDLFIIALSRKAFQVIKIWGSRADPAEDTRPSALPLLTIDDLTREKVDRLNEIGIDNAQVLAHQNPFMMLPRLPYELSLMVDWVSQAQLYALVKDKAFDALRKVYVRNIIDLHVRLKDDAGNAPVCAALALDTASAAALVRQLEADAFFMQLKQLAEAQHPKA